VGHDNKEYVHTYGLNRNLPILSHVSAGCSQDWAELLLSLQRQSLLMLHLQNPLEPLAPLRQVSPVLQQAWAELRQGRVQVCCRPDHVQRLV
jgi:hypothetical protein